MNDDVKGDLMQRSREWLQSCVNAATRSGVPEEADLEAFILAHLTATPLADRIAELEAEQDYAVSQVVEATAARLAAEAERDALFVSHANLAAVLADINEAVGGAAGEEPSLVRAVRTLVAERDALRAQVKAARIGLNLIANGYDDGVMATLWNDREAQGHAQDTLAAMDGAKPK